MQAPSDTTATRTCIGWHTLNQNLCRSNSTARLAETLMTFLHRRHTLHCMCSRRATRMRKLCLCRASDSAPPHLCHAWHSKLCWQPPGRSGTPLQAPHTRLQHTMQHQAPRCRSRNAPRPQPLRALTLNLSDQDNRHAAGAPVRMACQKCMQKGHVCYLEQHVSHH